jgi:hypothetical protein
MMDQD